ncbi:hypothetical protein ILUMI_09335 [Ignelater luminosus]|uniref:Uncharacterized protein n=1 Tax=Ignelater luminosus TaxID=2038154 RepID=A0A8K0D5Z4_IGNLU|nr:hypothetical protein ILUMI_09335 [Ignelater luminosus]
MASIQFIILVVVARLSLSLGTTTDKSDHSHETTAHHKEVSSSTNPAHHEEATTAKSTHSTEASSTKNPLQCGDNEIYQQVYDPNCEPTCNAPIKILCIPDKTNFVSPYCKCLLGFVRNSEHKCVTVFRC